jgi:hypothetical protein
VVVQFGDEISPDSHDVIEKFKNDKSLNHDALVLHWRQDPVAAAKDILGVELDTPQQITLNAWWSHDTSTGILSRGMGKTYLGAIWCTLQGLLWPAQKVGIIAPSFRQSKFVFSEIERLYEKSPMLQEACSKAPTKQPESCILKFDAATGKVGSFIEALPMGTDGGKIRGARYYRVFGDEWAQIDADTWDTVVSGFLATQSEPMERVREYERQMELIRTGQMKEEDMKMPDSNKVVGASTAFFQYNHLWGRVSQTIKTIAQQYHDRSRKGQDVSRFQLLGGGLNQDQIPHRLMSNGTECLVAFEYTDMHPAFMDRKRIEVTKSKMSEYKARMEYHAYFPPDSEGFYRRSLLDAARAHKEFTCQPAPRKGMIYVLGIDPARTSDNFSIAIFEVDPSLGCINLVRVMAWNKKNFPHMHQEVREIIRRYGVKHIGMDGGGGGTTIRDLLASKENCPPGQKLILEQEFDEHRGMVGDRILHPLIQFSNYEWCHDANFSLLASLQHGRLKLAARPDNKVLVWSPEIEEMDLELEEGLQEWSSIVALPSGNRTRWDTPTETMRKDRYSAILIGHWIALQVLDRVHRPQELAFGGWA